VKGYRPEEKKLWFDSRQATEFSFSAVSKPALGPSKFRIKLVSLAISVGGKVAGSRNWWLAND